jgi:hypothetical protein
MTGMISGLPSYMSLPGSPSYEEVYTVHFDGMIANGDCGSLVESREDTSLVSPRIQVEQPHRYPRCHGRPRLPLRSGALRLRGHVPE